MFIYFAMQQMNFELRWRFVVSSLMQQQLPHNTRIAIDCTLLRGYENKLLFPEKLCPFLRYYRAPRRTFARRGFIRNQQVTRAIAAGADWIYFTDADHVYPPEYVKALVRFAKANRKEDRVVYDWSKWTMHREDSQRLVEHPIGWEVPNVFDRVAQLRQVHRGRGLHAGGAMQFARVRAIVEKNCGRYIHPRYRRTWDWNMFVGQRARSDWQFRATMGERRVLLDTRPQAHLDHIRDKEMPGSRHTEEQR